MRVVSQFVVSHENFYLITMKRILHFLKGAMDFGLCFKKNIKDVVMDQTHFDGNINHGQG
jgi:hypothetical protein